MDSVRFEHVTKRFPSPGRPALLRAALPLAADATSGRTALDDVSFAVRPGQVLGIIGPNGAGKSTLLKLASGILQATEGTVSLSGTPSSMIELGFSFHPNLTGWENLPLAAAILGLHGREYEERIDDIVGFSGIREFLDLPVKHLSTGMAARLGFALATHVPTPVLLIDEVLAVGDLTFQMACIKRVRALAEAGTSILFVSHSLELVYQVCDRALRLDAGRVVDDGGVSEVIAQYERHTAMRRGGGVEAGRITSVDLATSTVATGDHLPVNATVEVQVPGKRLRLVSEFKDPMNSSGFVNLDRIPDGALSQPGLWELHAAVGPIVATAGKLELGLSLIEDDGTETGRLLDRSSQFFEVTGQDIGVVRMAMDAEWEVEPAGEPTAPKVAAPRPPRERGVLWAEGLTKVFPPRRHDTGHLQLRGSRHHGALTALRDVSFSVGRGEAVGIIGPNGAGKSTLLRLLTGVSGATSGTCGHEGKVASVLELGTGFHPELSGRENLWFSWKLHGGDPAAWSRALEEIVAFADIGPVLDEPVKHYSTGMTARLTIALALELRADVLIIDEALSVGDIGFRESVRLRLLDLTKSGTALLFASHDLDLINAICTRSLRFDAGELVEDGPTHEVVASVGGLGWAGGAGTSGGAILVTDLEVIPGRLPWNAPFEVRFVLEVVRPEPATYLEFSIRDALGHAVVERPTRAEMLAWIEHVHRIEGISHLFRTPGRHVLHGRLAGVPLLNSHDVVISALDEMDGSVLTEHGRTTFFGARGESVARLDLQWSLVAGPSDPPAS